MMTRQEIEAMADSELAKYARDLALVCEDAREMGDRELPELLSTLALCECVFQCRMLSQHQFWNLTRFPEWVGRAKARYEDPVCQEVLEEAMTEFVCASSEIMLDDPEITWWRRKALLRNLREYSSHLHPGLRERVHRAVI